MKVGIDTGGTFTDLIAIDDKSNEIITAKVPSTPKNPTQSIRNILNEVQVKEIQNIILATTVAINTILERKGSNIVFITTKGFEDLLLIQRADRKSNYDLHWEKPKPLVRQRCCLGVLERINYKGDVIHPLRLEEMTRIVSEINRLVLEEKVKAIGICLLFSFQNPIHEIKLKEFLKNSFPDIPISISSEVAPIWREYERANTVAVDAYIKPTIKEYVESAKSAFEEFGIKGIKNILKSNGGISILTNVAGKPAEVILSGIVGGIVAGSFWGSLLGLENIITFDMGGTSCDIGVVNDGRVAYTTDFEIEWGLPVMIPAIDVSTIGAGGGSIAWIDKGGFINVGPQSAGADPGPICYGKGGEEVTITDANLILKRLNPNNFLGGKLKLIEDLAEKGIFKLARGLTLSKHEAAVAVVQIANNNMAEAIKLVTVYKGIDPREYTLIAFGGAGPLHACEVARELLIRRIIIPIYPGQFSALGTLISDIRVDRVATVTKTNKSLDLCLLNAQLKKKEKEALAELREDGYYGKAEVFRFLSLRYLDQNYEQDIPLLNGELTSEHLLKAYLDFHERHENFYGYSFPDEIVEIVNIKTIVYGIIKKPFFPRLPSKVIPDFNYREVYFEKHGFLKCPVFQRDLLGKDFKVDGPAIVEEAASTTLIPLGFILSLDEIGNLVLTLDGVNA